MTNGTLVTNTPVVYLAPKNCPYSFNGQNLAAMRRAKLRQIAKALKVSPDGSKQEILKRLIGALGVAGAPKELNDL